MTLRRAKARCVAIFTFVLGVFAGLPAAPQTGPQLIITMNLAGQVKDVGSYYIAFNVDETILLGPQADSRNWTHYILYRGGRFFFGTIPRVPFRPFGFESIRPPVPYPFGQLLPDRRTIRVRIAVADLRVGATPPRRIKVNFVTVDETLRPLDALGKGADDPLGFVTLDLQRDVYTTVTDPEGDCPDPAFDITGGDIQVGWP
jgi:hypothetical protein